MHVCIINPFIFLVNFFIYIFTHFWKQEYGSMGGGGSGSMRDVLLHFVQHQQRYGICKKMELPKIKKRREERKANTDLCFLRASDMMSRLQIGEGGNDIYSVTMNWLEQGRDAGSAPSPRLPRRRHQQERTARIIERCWWWCRHVAPEARGGARQVRQLGTVGPWWAGARGTPSLG